tara:strand:- start:291 stop:701 length:411 start_codon:yes stop_codon:yes gene_type:complete
MKMYSLKNGCDLLESLLDFAKNKKIQSCWILGIGALKQANIAWYNQKKERYEEIFIEEDLEIVSLSGNISLKSDSNTEDAIFPHFHISLSDKKGQTYGGHVLKGCEVFVCEFMVMKSSNQKVRFFDQERGLWLWHD